MLPCAIVVHPRGLNTARATEKRVRAKSNFASDLNARHSVQSPDAKIFRFPSVYQQRILTPSTPPKGRIAIVNGRGVGCDGRIDLAGERHRSVRSSRVVLIPRRWDQFAKMICGRRWLISPVHREEHGAAAQPSRRECRSVSATCSDYRSCTFSFVREAAGAQNTRHSLLPLVSRDDVDAELGQIMPRECGSLPFRHCERSEAIHSSACGAMDCFVAALLAMTKCCLTS